MDKNNAPFLPLPCTVIIVAGGVGSRFGKNLPKQYALIQGKPVLSYTISAFASHPHVKQILVVIGHGHEAEYHKSIVGLPKLLAPVYGGTSRQESVFNALQSLHLKEDDVVLIHDAARPCVSKDLIDSILISLNKYKASSLGMAVTDTLRKTDGIEYQEIIDRHNIYSMQTPQGFHFGLIKAAHEKFKGLNFTDDTALVSGMGIPVTIVHGDRKNIKITTQEDMMIAETVLGRPSLIPRTGIGFDVHAFGEPSNFIRIGGIDIPHTHKLKGHSDADVLLHAITDALYGVIADGDIGSHFAPSNPSYKNMDSALFLGEALKAVQNKGGRLIHVDCIVMCEAPKIGPHRSAIQRRIADILSVPLSRISIKATTTEELGFTGRREGIAAQAAVTVLLPDEVSI
jgi:2-C-methyl-D-erythritol 4-phosphate cytidylyltransferase / 2-C-methyl-D-erythritol 2,4-cyclodiphosphate synthase